MPEVEAPQPEHAPAYTPTVAPQTEQPAQSKIEQMQELLEQLKEPLDNETYQLLLNRARQLAPGFFQTTGIVGQLTLLSLLDNQRKDRQRSEEQRQAANACTDALLTELTRRVLVDAVGEQSLKASQQRVLGKLMVSLGSKVAPQLLKRLYAERDAIIRRRYVEILARMGEPIFELLKKDLQTNTWHQARNVVTILGQSRLETALPLLTQVIDHPEVRVRRTVIRALGAIGGNQVIPLLVKLAHDPDEELHQPAIMALGGLKNPRAIPPLVSMLKRRDLLGKQTTLKTEVIQALATTDSPQAILPLLKLARKANLLNRKSIETLRAEAVLALGQLGNDQLISVLKQLPRRDKSPLSKAIKQATDQLRKQQNVV
jgi:HEAT repeat protein